jgi:excisionase family DNA binding protein
MADRLLTVAEAAEFLAVSQSTLRRWLRGRQIEHVRLGRSVRIRFSVLERWLNDRTVQPTDYAGLL